MTHNRRSLRGGTVLIVALVCLLVGMTLVCALLQSTLRARRQWRLERDRRQTELLLQAGLDRAALRLAQDAEYRGEAWQVPPDSLGGASAGHVTIEASRSSDDRPWQVHVVAEYPVADTTLPEPTAPNDLSIRRSRTILVQPEKQAQE